MDTNIDELKKIVSNLDIEENDIKKQILDYLLILEKEGINPTSDIFVTIPRIIERNFILNKVVNLSSSKRKRKNFFELVTIKKDEDIYKWKIDLLKKVEELNEPKIYLKSFENKQTEKIDKLEHFVDYISKKVEFLEEVQTKNINDIKSLKELVFDIVKDNNLKEKKQFLPINIYLDTNDPEKIFEVYKSIIDLIDVLEFEKGIELDAENGSWIKRMIAKSKKVMTEKEVTDRLKEIEYALEVKILKEQSEVDKNQSEALSNILTSLKDIPNAAIKIGSLLVVKITVDGVSSVQVRSLTILELHYLNKHPDLLLQPANILKALATMTNNDEKNNLN